MKMREDGRVWTWCTTCHEDRWMWPVPREGGIGYMCAEEPAFTALSWQGRRVTKRDDEVAEARHQAWVEFAAGRLPYPAFLRAIGASAELIEDAERPCFNKGCTPIYREPNLGGGRDWRVGVLNPPFVWIDEAGDRCEERYCICLTMPTKGRVRLLCNGAPDANAYERLFKAMREHDAATWPKEGGRFGATGESLKPYPTEPLT